MKPVNSVLVIKLGTIAEFVLSLPAMKRIREAHPAADITLLTTSRFEQIAKSSRYFNHVTPEGEGGGFGHTWAVIRWIRRHKFDRIYDLEGSKFTGALFQGLRPFPPEWSGPASGAALQHRNPRRGEMHVLERQAEQLQQAGIWADAPTAPGMAPPPDLSWIVRRAPEPRPTPGAVKPRPYVLMAPGGSRKNTDKLWPVENYAALAGRLHALGLDIVIVGGPEESALARAIQHTVKHARDLTGRADFAQIAVLGARAALAVGNDSGATHLAAAAGAPTIALFSKASDPQLSGPRGYVAILHATHLKNMSVDQVFDTAKVLVRPA